MNWFIGTIVTLLTLSIVGKTLILYEQNKVRDLRFLPWDIIMNVLLIIWGVILWERLP